MRFTLVSDDCVNAITFIDNVTGRCYSVLAGDDEAEYDWEEMRFLVDLLNTGDQVENNDSLA